MPTERNASQRKTRNHRRFLLIWTPITIVLLAGLLTIMALLTPQIGRVQYTLAGGENQTAILPLFIDEQSEPWMAAIPIRILFPQTGILRIVPDDCLEEVRIGGKKVDLPDVPFCDGTNGRVIDVSGILQPGVNMLELTMKDTGGKAGLQVFIAKRQWWQMLLDSALIFTLAGYGLIAVQTYARTRRWKLLAYTVIAAAVFAMAYNAATPLTSRAYDIDGHLEYIRYVHEHLRIPPAQEGWQFYQPPLYYFITGGSMRLWSALGFLPNAVYDRIALFSLFVFLGTIGVTAWIGLLSFEEQKKKSSWEPALFAALVLFLPGILFFTSRVTNDVLLLITSFVFCAQLIQWWQTGSVKMWYLLVCTLALALLSKSNSLPFAPLLFFCLLIHPSVSLRRKSCDGVMGILILALLVGWLYVLRFVIENETFIVGNMLNEGLRVENTLRHVLEFHPYAVIGTPFNGTWDDVSRRQYFWEFLFRSAFFGEWSFSSLLLMPHLARAMLSLAISLLVIGVIGFWRDCVFHFRRTVPMALILLATIASVFLYRLRSPYSPNQDFRFVPLLAVAVSYYCVRGIQAMQGWMKLLAIGVAVLFVLLECVFIALLIYEG